MKVKNVVRTCAACPSQWEAETEDGRGVYIRYRYGCIQVWVSHNAGEDGLDGDCVFGDCIGDDFDGCIPWDVVEKIIERI